MGLSVLMHVMQDYYLSSVATVTTMFHFGSVNGISTRTVLQELHKMGFHGLAATHKPNMIMLNAKSQLEWCKERHHWMLEQ